MILYAKKDAERLSRNPFSVGELDRFIPLGFLPMGTKVEVEKFVVERFPSGTRRFAVLKNGEYVDSNDLSSYHFLTDEEKQGEPKPKAKRDYRILFYVAAAAAALYFGRRVFKPKE